MKVPKDFKYNVRVFVLHKHANANDVNAAMATAKYPWYGLNELDTESDLIYYRIYLDKNDLHLLLLFFDYDNSDIEILKCHRVPYALVGDDLLLNNFDDTLWRK